VRIPYSKATISFSPTSCRLCIMNMHDHPDILVFRTVQSVQTDPATASPRKRRHCSHCVPTFMCSHPRLCRVTKELAFLLFECDLFCFIETFATTQQKTHFKVQLLDHRSDYTKHNTTQTLKHQTCLTTTTLPNSPSKAVACLVASAMLLVVWLPALEVLHRVCVYSLPLVST
jgi:hypothetical protein